jgi:hypothetical protein
MSLFFLMNNVTVKNSRLLAGTQVNDATDDAAAIRAAGGVLWPNGDAVVAAAAAIAQGLKLRGGAVDEAQLAAIMEAAATSVSRVQVGSLTLVGGSKTVNTGITITASSKVIPILESGGAATSGARYRVSGLTVGGPGTGAFTVDAVDLASGNNVVATDISVLGFVIIG